VGIQAGRVQAQGVGGKQGLFSVAADTAIAQAVGRQTIPAQAVGAGNEQGS